MAKWVSGTELCTVHMGNKSEQKLAGWRFTSYGSVLALHQSRSICLTFLALGGSAKEHFWAETAAGPALQRRGHRKTAISYLTFKEEEAEMPYFGNYVAKII